MHTIGNKDTKQRLSPQANKIMSSFNSSLSNGSIQSCVFILFVAHVILRFLKKILKHMLLQTRWVFAEMAINTY